MAAKTPRTMDIIIDVTYLKRKVVTVPWADVHERPRYGSPKYRALVERLITEAEAMAGDPEVKLEWCSTSFTKQGEDDVFDEIG